MSARHAGVLLPLFSCRSSRSWGIGELPDLVPLGVWMATAGLDRLMLLPLGTMPDDETSPYSAASSMAIDPIYIAVAGLDEFRRAGGLAALPGALRVGLEAAIDAPCVRYDDVRRAKMAALDLAFSRFVAEEWTSRSTRAEALAAYAAREAWWLDDYALFRVLGGGRSGRSWREWPASIRDRHPDGLRDARRSFEGQILQEQYLQWLAEGQWQAARQAIARQGVSLIGDLAFVSALESADVWARADEYLLDGSVGAPPDAFSDEGQDWQLPGYRWDVIAANDYELVARRARRMAALFDGIRIDHLVGLYRTYNRPTEGPPFFLPAEEHRQRAQGEAVLRVLKQSGARLLAEDLGTVPDFVRESMARLGVPGTKLLRWERDWHPPYVSFVDPAAYPAASIAMTGTHDTETLAVWWEQAGAAVREAVFALPAMRASGLQPTEPWSEALRDALLSLVWRSGSDEVFVPVQDVFGWRDRINTPGTVHDGNWTWTLPWPVDALGREPEAVHRARALGALSKAAGRLSECS